MTGEDISLDSKNKLLALIAYGGLGSPWASKEVAGDIMEEYRDLQWWPLDQKDVYEEIAKQSHQQDLGKGGEDLKQVGVRDEQVSEQDGSETRDQVARSDVSLDAELSEVRTHLTRRLFPNHEVASWVLGRDS